MAFLVFHALVNGPEQAAALLDVSGRQRMLVQRLAADAQLLASAPAAEQKALRQRLASELDSLDAVQYAFDYSMLTASIRQQVEQIDNAPPHWLYRRLDEYRDNVRTFAVLPDDQVTLDNPLLNRIEEAAAGPLLSATDALVTAVDEGIRERVAELHIFAVVGESLFLALLLAMHWKVFRPLVHHTDRALEQLAALEGYHRSVVDALVDGVLVIEPLQRRVEAMNPAARAIFPSADEECSLTELMPLTGELAQAELCQWDRREVVGKGPDGTTLYFEVTIRCASLHRRDRLIVFVRDVTRRVEAEEKAYTLSRALEQSAASALLTDTDGVILYANPRVCEISGYSRDELLGATPRILKSQLTPPAVYAEMWDNLRAGKGWKGELLNRKKSGELYWDSLVISPLRNKEGKITQHLAVMEDITQRKNMEEALVVAKQQAEQASRAKSDFLASMSHELRTPLNAIIGYSQFIDTEPFGPVGHPKYREYLGHIEESGQHLLELINDMLDLAKVESGKLPLGEENVDLAACAESALRLVFERANRGGVELSRDIAADLPALWADPLRLKQILLNLLTNAIKFTPEGGRVTLKVRTDETGGAVLMVEDTGIGIAAEDIPKVLEPFGQVSNPMVRRDEGTGLGLPISKQLVELHGGTLVLSSEPGHGTTAIVRMPAERVRQATAIAE
jgi:PAS domain S-box-containing protein